jgi:ketosteroid isomerase-like protein
LSRPRGGDKTGEVGFDIDQLMQLWDGPVPDGDAAEEAFAAVYADPVTVNGQPIAVSELVAVARDMHATFHDQRRTVLERVDEGDRVTVVFTVSGVRDGRLVEMLVIDLLTIADGRITAVWAVSQPAPPAQGG